MFERLDGAGGYAHTFRRGPYVFDPAIHVIPQAASDGTVDLLLRYLGVHGRCTFEPLPSLYQVAFPGDVFEVPVGLERLIEAHGDACPGDAAGISDFFRLCERFVEEAHQVPVQLPLSQLDRAVEQFPTLFGYRTRTLADVLAEFVPGARARALCAATWPLLGLPPSRLAFELFARFLITQSTGNFHCVGGFQNFVDAFVVALEDSGGRLVTGGEVRRIVIRDGRAAGVELEGGQRVQASVVISNGDAHHTFHDLVGLDHLPAGYLRRLSRLRPSISAFVVYAATSLSIAELDVAHQTFIFRDHDHESSFEGLLRGEAAGAQLVLPSLHDNSLAPSGEQIVAITSLAPYDLGRPWPEAKQELEDAYLALVERVLPGLRGCLTHVESSTPIAMERYTRNHWGAAYGWENAPDQSASKRLTYETPVPGLYLSGHWTQPGSALRVVVSGTHVAQAILRERGVKDVGPSF